MEGGEDKFLIEHAALCRQLRKVLKSESSDASDKLEKNLQRYEASFDGLDLSDQHEIFLSLYRKKRLMILLGTNDSWLLNEKGGQREDLFLSLEKKGSGGKKKRSVEVSLSHIFRLACRQQKEAEVKLKDLPEAWATCESLILADSIKLHLYRIWNFLVLIDTEKKKLQMIVERYERALSSGSLTEEAPVNPPLQADGMAAIFGNLVKQLGVNTQTQMNTQSLPDGQKVSSALKGIMSDPRTTDLISTTVDSIKGANSLEEMIGAVARGFQQGGLMERFQALTTTFGQNVNAPSTSGSSSISTSTSTDATSLISNTAPPVPSTTTSEVTSEPLLTFDEKKE